MSVTPVLHQPGVPATVGLDSVVFYVVLLVSAGLFGVVALGPRVEAHLRLQDDYVAGQRDLVQWEDKVQELQAAGRALQDDDAFLQEMARVECRWKEASEELIPVHEVALQFRRSPKFLPQAEAATTQAWHGPLRLLLSDLAARPTVRTSLLAGAAVLVVAAFAMFPAGAEAYAAAGESCLAAWGRDLRLRYSTVTELDSVPSTLHQDAA